jgi:hypothetical protein
MWLELLLCVVVLIGMFVLFYKGAVHEFHILQHDWSDDTNWVTLLSERAPLVIRDIPPELVGGWTRRAVGRRAWPLLLSNDQGRVRMPCSEWMQTPLAQIEGRTIENGERVATSAGLPDIVQDWRRAGLYRWMWLPTSTCAVILLPPTETACMPLQKVRSDCQWIVCTDGAPLRLWLAHEGSIPSDMAVEGQNPWTLTAEQVPWIVDVKFMEMRLRPGCAVLLPTHWWVAAKPELPIVSDAPTVGDGSWGWMADLDTPISWMFRKVTPKQS